VLASVGDVVAGPELPDHLDGLLEHLKAHVGRRPRIAEDVLVEGLPATDPETERAAAHEHGAGRGGLRDDGRVGAHRGTRHRRGDRQVAGLRQGADHRPDERALTLRRGPRVEVVADPEPLEAGLLGQGVACSISSAGEYSSHERK